MLISSVVLFIWNVWYVSPSGLTTRQFVGHTKDVLSVAFSADNRQIVSGSRDKTIKLWNTLGVCKYTIQVSYQLMFLSRWVRVSFSSKIRFFGFLENPVILRLWENLPSYSSVWYKKIWCSVSHQWPNCRQSCFCPLVYLIIDFNDCIWLLKKLIAVYCFTLQDEGHSEWVSCVRFSPNSSNPIIVSCGWDKMVKVCSYWT